MAYNGQDEQDMLQQMLGGTPTNQTQPAGVAPLTPEAPQAAGPVGNGVDARKALGGYAGVGTMRGFNTAMDYGDDKAANSVKNTFGRIASRYANKPSSIDSIMADPDFQRYFSGAKKVQGGAGDKIDFGGVLSDFESGVPVGVVDVLGAADPNADTSVGWTWQDEANDGGGAMPGAGGGVDPMAMMGGQSGMGGLDALANSDVLAQILATLQKNGAGQGDEQALLQSLMGGQ
jgi:hypothetical protein